MKKSRVHNPKYLEKYFTQFPNILDDSTLTPFEFRLLIHYYRVGECWEGVRKTSEICKMSTGKVAESRKVLEEKGFITTEQRGDGIIIFLVDLSKENVEKYGNQGVHAVNDSVHAVNTTRSPGEHKKNHLKNNQEEEHEESKDSSFHKPVLAEEQALSIELPNTANRLKKVYPEFVKLWTSQFPSLGFNAVSGKKIKSMIITSFEIVKEREVKYGNERNLTEDDRAIGLFQYLLDFAKRTNNWAYGKSITTFEMKYREIYNEKENGKSKSPHQRQSARDIINSL